jgi:hypothetical protein
LLAAVEVKMKKAHLSYIKKCHNIYQMLLYVEFFIPHSVETMSEKTRKNMGKIIAGKLEVI